MKARVIRTSSQHDSVEARTCNNILIVFSSPYNFRLNDEVEFIDFVMSGKVELRNYNSGVISVVVIRPNNVHDLDIPMRHGTSRQPSLERMHRDA